MKKINNPDEFIQEIANSLTNKFNNLSYLEQNKIENDKNLIVCIDLNNGFCKDGALFSSRNKDLVADTAVFFKTMKQKTDAQIIAITDSHNEECNEYKVFLKHCLKGSYESEFCEELLPYIDQTIEKNSTNGALVFDYSLMADYDNIFICGCCTDICILQFALSISSYINENDLSNKVYLLAALVDTFDFPGHNADYYNLVSLDLMDRNGIIIHKNIK